MQLTAVISTIILLAASVVASPNPQLPPTGMLTLSTPPTSLTAVVAGPSASSLSASNPAGNVPVWVIKVGSAKDDLVFSPNSIQAKPGDMVQFQFYSQNHSVASASFDAPCVPQLQSQPNAPNAFWSGFMPTTAQGQLLFTMRVQDTNPIYFYCSQGRHCQNGMVGAINAPATGNTLAAFAQKAAQAPDNIAPSSSGASTGAAPPATSAVSGLTGVTTPPPGVAATSASTAKQGNAAVTSFGSANWRVCGVIALAVAFALL